MENSKITFNEMFKALEDAQKQYDAYLKMGDELAAIQMVDIAEEYRRDENHPLSLAIRG